MFTKTKLALAAALVLGAASAVQANDNDRNDRGGYRVGPMGQHFGGANPAYHPSMRYGYDFDAYAFAPGYDRVPARPYYRPWGWGWDWE
jgi:opacity protein-like surface antigen